MNTPSSPYRPRLFNSFISGGFECSSHRRHDGRRLDLLQATAHDRLAGVDYRALRTHGLCTVRDGLRWHLIERRPGVYDWSSFTPMLEAARACGTQVIWDLCHYGWPDDLDIWRPAFVTRFAEFARAVARLVRDHSDAVPFYCPINEISYLSWAGGEMGRINPMGQGRGLELKHQLVRACLAAVDAVRSVDPRARFVHVDPLINVMAATPGDEPEAAAQRRAQYDSWLLLSGELWPGLGGDSSFLDITGVNYYADNQWFLGGPTVSVGEPGYRPLRELLAEAHRRFERPLLIAETGAEGLHREPWLDYVFAEVAAALAAGTPVEGVCLYPVLDYPGWVNERHCETGLYGMADERGQRSVHPGVAQALRRGALLTGTAQPAAHA